MSIEASAPRRAPQGTPLYVHLPFCVTKCHYCDFFSVVDEGQDIDGAIEAVLHEARRFAPLEPRTVFFGGGTPSLLSTSQLTHLLDGLHAITRFRGAAEEVTLECNPESLDAEKARRLIDLGVDRLSIGFQSLRQEVLELFGRAHSVGDSFRAFEAARQAGFRRVSIDLIYAAPGETSESWSRDFRRVLALEPDHFSAYNLTFEEDTPFSRWLESGRIRKTSEQVELEMFDLTRQVAAEHAYGAYEISNYALSGEECRHNVNYWHNGPYLGLGPSAVSKVGSTRWGNPRSISAWRRCVCADGPATWSETPEPRARLAETWWLGLRLSEGVDPARARRTAGFVEGGDPALAIAEGLGHRGFLERRGPCWRLSQRGLPLADAVAREFLRLGLEPQPVS
jgi:oxygen-independent coproporphyrinogen-3 oxidase